MHVSRWLCDHPELVRGRSVHELGAGVALPSLTSAVLGAASVIASDCDAYACAATRRACEHNADVSGCAELRSVQVVQLDWFDALRPEAMRCFAPPAADVVLAADVNYYARANPALLASVRACLRPGGTLALASRMGRAGLPGFLSLLDRHDSGFQLVQEESFATDVEGSEDRMWIYCKRDPAAEDQKDYMGSHMEAQPALMVS